MRPLKLGRSRNDQAPRSSVVSRMFVASTLCKYRRVKAAADHRILRLHGPMFTIRSKFMQGSLLVTKLERHGTKVVGIPALRRRESLRIRKSRCLVCAPLSLAPSPPRGQMGNVAQAGPWREGRFGRGAEDRDSLRKLGCRIASKWFPSFFMPCLHRHSRLLVDGLVVLAAAAAAAAKAPTVVHPPRSRHPCPRNHPT